MNPDTPDDAEYLNSRMLPFVALATMVTLFAALGWLVDGGVGRYRALVLIGCCRIGGLVISNEVILWDLIAGVATCEYSRRKFVALKKSSLVRLAQRNAARLLSGLLSTLESVGTVQSLNRATVPGPGSIFVKCCGSATSRKNQRPHHLFAQELGKVPVRNPSSAYVVHCIRELVKCPIDLLC